MRYRQLGRTGLKVSEISFGCASLGQDYGGRKAPSRKDAIRLLRKAYECGITFFDTAPSYGDSEEILGEALDADDAIFCTKVEAFNSPIADMRKSIGLSARRLGRVDILLTHHISIAAYRANDTVRLFLGGLNYLKGYGLSTNVGFDRFLFEPRPPIIQAPYNIINREIEWEECSGELPAIIARQPYARGLLCNPPWSIGEQALRFCLSNKHISTVLVGMQTEEELEQNLEWASRGPLPLENP